MTMNNKLIGNAVVGQSGGPTAAINATLAGVIEGAFAHSDTVPKLYGMRNGIEGFIGERLCDLTSLFSDEKGELNRELLHVLTDTLLITFLRDVKIYDTDNRLFIR